MALNDLNVAVAVTGAVYKGDGTTVAPTGTASALHASLTDLGYISEDGIVESHPNGGDPQRIKAWQNGRTVRTISTPSEDNPTFTFTMLETKKATVETRYGTTVTQTATEGSFLINAQASRTRVPYLIDVVDGAELERVWIPAGEVVEVGDKTYVSEDAYSYEVTIEAVYNSALGGNAKVWSTRLKTPA